jgi:HEAT repeat protein
MEEKMARVYVSSTYNDLKECREQVRLALRRTGHEDVAMEYYVAEDKRPLERCLEDVTGCDLYVGIFALRYGYVPEGCDKSITEQEFRKAVETGKDCLIFLRREDAIVATEIEFSAIEKINALRDELGKDYLVGFFSNKDNLRSQVLEAIHKWEKERGIDSSKYTDWEAYREKIYQEYRWVRLSVIAGAARDRIARIPLADVFVSQMAAADKPSYDISEETIALKHTLFKEEAGEEEELAEEIAETPNPKSKIQNPKSLEGIPEPVLGILGREGNQVILGGPGSGKSTLLHYTLLSLSDTLTSPPAPLLRGEGGRMGGEGRRMRGEGGRMGGEGVTEKESGFDLPLPFLIELRQYVLKKAANFIEYIVATAKDSYGVALTADAVESLLNEPDRVLLLFDGLDEVFDRRERSRMLEQFRRFAQQHPQVRLIVTSRIAGYDATELQTAGFQHYTLLDFSTPQIREFVPKWYQYYTWEGDERDAAGLIERILESPRLLDLAGNPLLLTMMAVIYKHQDLPEQRWKLYERCTEVLLEDWDIKRKSIDFKEIPLDIPIRTQQKAEILQRVSMYMLERGQAGRELNAIAYQPLLDILAQYLQEKYNKPSGEAEAIAIDVLAHLRERTFILAEIGEGIFGFVHRTFMEYFAACNCLAEFNRRKADYDWLKQEVFGKYWQKDEWQEVLFLLVAMLAAQDSPVQEVVDYLRQQRREGEMPFNLVFAARCLGESRVIEDESWAKGLVTELVEEIGWYTDQTKTKNIQAPSFIRAGLTAFSLLVPILKMPQPVQDRIRRLSRQQLITGWQMNLAMQLSQKSLTLTLAALEDKEKNVALAAIATLEREYPGNTEVGHALTNLMKTECHIRIKEAAIEALQRSWSGNREVEEELFDAIAAQIGKESAETYIRWVFEQLATQWQTNPQTLPLLQERAVNDDNEWVRCAAVEAIIEHFRDDPQTLPLLQDLAVNDDYYYVRHTAVEALAKYFRDDPETLPLLQERAVNDDNKWVRCAAVEALAEHFRDDPQTLPLLQDLAENDPDWWVCHTAKNLIRRYFRRMNR